MSARAAGGSERDEAGPVIRAGLARGVALFNGGDHWGSHEAWEGAWHVARGQDRPFLQGLIQAAAAFHKLRVQDNPRGARRLLARALQRLDPLPPEHHGLALASLRAQLSSWYERLERHGEGPYSEALRGMPNIAWSPEGRRARLRVSQLRVQPVAVGERRALILEVHGAGHRGLAECPLPWRRQGTRRSIQRVLGPALLAEPIAAPSALPLRWHDMAEDPFAAAALECAVWDLWARVNGWSLPQALGLTERPLELAVTLRGASESELRSDARALETRGYHELTLRARPGADRRLLPGLAGAVSKPFAIDLGRAYRPADLYALQALAATGPTALLRPTPRRHLHEMIRLRRWLDVPVVAAAPRDLGEGEAQLRLAATDELLIDPMRCGPTAALELAEAAQAHGVAARLRCQARSPIGARAALAIAMHPAFTRPADVGRPPSGTRADAEGQPASHGAIDAAWPTPDEPPAHGFRRGEAASDESWYEAWLAATAVGAGTRLVI